MNRDFKGVWIPKEVYLDERLNALDKIILAEIDSLDNEEKGCYASNQYLAEFCQCSQTKVSTAISKLIEYGYVDVVDFDGRHRVLKSRLSKNEYLLFKNCKADIKKVKANNKDNKQDNNKDSIYSEITDIFNDVCVSLPRCIKVTDKRKTHIKKRIADYGKDQLIMAFRKMEQSDFLSGRSGRWKASFDWLIKSSDNVAKVLEGQYDNRLNTTHDKLKEAFDRL